MTILRQSVMSIVRARSIVLLVSAAAASLAGRSARFIVHTSPVTAHANVVRGRQILFLQTQCCEISSGVQTTCSQLPARLPLDCLPPSILVSRPKASCCTVPSRRACFHGSATKARKVPSIGPIRLCRKSQPHDGPHEDSSNQLIGTINSYSAL